MAFDAETILANIKERLGENGKHVWNYYGLKNGTAWCAGEVSYTFAKTGNKTAWYGGKPVFYVPTAQTWMAAHWSTIYDYRTGGDLKTVKAGDVVVFMWTKGSRDHIGFARAAGTSANLYTIEGNTSGGKVAERTRAKANIYGVYRPPWTGSGSKDSTKPAAKKANLPTYKAGKTYTVQVNDLNVRTGPGTNYARKTRAQLTADGRKHADAEGQLKKGTRVTVSASKVVDGSVWVRIPSGWVCAYNGKKKYIS